MSSSLIRFSGKIHLFNPPFQFIIFDNYFYLSFFKNADWWRLKYNIVNYAKSCLFIWSNLLNYDFWSKDFVLEAEMCRLNTRNMYNEIVRVL